MKITFFHVLSVFILTAIPMSVEMRSETKTEKLLTAGCVSCCKPRCRCPLIDRCYYRNPAYYSRYYYRPYYYPYYYYRIYNYYYGPYWYYHW